MMRVGWGFDAHAFAAGGEVTLLGIVADDTRGVAATSDGDVAAHAVADALLGAAALGDLGAHFPGDDTRWHDADSMVLLGEVVQLLAAAGSVPTSVDVTIVSQSVRVAPHREAMRSRLAATLGLDESAVSVKATTTDGLGYLGRDEGLAAHAVAVIQQG